NDQAGAVFDIDVPLLGREAGHGRVNASRRLAGHQATCPLSRVNFNQMSVAVQQAGGEVDQVEQGSRFVIKAERRHHTERDLLVAGSQTGLVTVPEELDASAADAGRFVLVLMKVPKLRRSQEVFARDGSCSRTHWITSPTPSFCRRLTKRNGR